MGDSLSHLDDLLSKGDPLAVVALLYMSCERRLKILSFHCKILWMCA